MTLVIADKTKDDMLIYSDTMRSYDLHNNKRIEDRVKLPSDSIPGTLKIFLLSKDLCFAFAGVNEYAYKALDEIVRKNRYSKKSISRVLLKWHVRSNIKDDDYLTDFLLCSATDRKTRKYTFGEELRTSHDIQWIGNKEAAEDILNRRMNFDQLVSSRKHADVGGVNFMVRTNNVGFFCAVGSTQRLYKSPNDCTGEEGRFLSVEDGGGTIFTIYPNKPIPARAIFIGSPVNVGYLYNPTKTEVPAKYTGMTIEEFVLEIGNIVGAKFSVPPSFEMTRSVG